MGLTIKTPLELWSKVVLRAIGESFSKFIVVDESVQGSLSINMAKILVKIDFKQGLFESIELVVGDYSYT